MRPIVASRNSSALHDSVLSSQRVSDMSIILSSLSAMKVYRSQAVTLENKVVMQQRYFNMVIHDLRMPSESIQQGLNQARDMLATEMNLFLLQTKDMIAKNFRNESITLNSKIASISTGSHIQKFNLNLGDINQDIINRKTLPVIRRKSTKDLAIFDNLLS